MFVLTREYSKNGVIMGSLWLNGGFLCYTAENESKSIPQGRYMVQVTRSPKFKRMLPLISGSGVAVTRGIRIHRGNSGVKDSQGCILVGFRRDVKQNLITESADAETMIALLFRDGAELVISGL